MKWVITSQILQLIPIKLSCFFNFLPKGRKAPTVKKVQHDTEWGVHSVYREHVRACNTILDNDLYPSAVSQQVEVHMSKGQGWNVLTSHNSSVHAAVLTNQQIRLVSVFKSVKKRLHKACEAALCFSLLTHLLNHEVKSSNLSSDSIYRASYEHILAW